MSINFKPAEQGHENRRGSSSPTLATPKMRQFCMRLCVSAFGVLLLTGCSVDLGGTRPCTTDKDCAKSEICGADKHCVAAPPLDRGVADKPLVDVPVYDVAAGDKPRGDSPVVKPDVPRVDLGKPDAPKPDISKPDAPKPDIAKPDLPKPDVAKPDATVVKPDVFKPDVFKPDTGFPVCVFDNPISTFDNCVFAP